MKIFQLEKGKIEEQERDKNNESLRSKGKICEILVPDEPDKVEESTQNNEELAKIEDAKI